MNKSLLYKTKTWLLSFLETQLFIHLISLPILICWGLPISLLSPLGNLIFAPIFVIFLFLSSLIFFSELLFIPNKFLILGLEQISNLWLNATKIKGYGWLVGFKKPHLIIILLIPIISILILHSKKINTATNRIIHFGALLIFFFGILKYAQRPPKTIQRLPCNYDQITFINHNKKLIMIDPGVIGQRISASSWIEFTLIPHILQTTGKTEIDHLIILQPGLLLFEALQNLVTKIKVNNIYLIWWEGTITKKAWRNFFIFHRTLQENNIQLKRIGKLPRTIELDQQAKITIKPLDKIIVDKDCSYPALSVVASINQDVVEIQSYKYHH